MLSQPTSTSLNDLKTVFLHDLSLFDVALVYILIYVIYKALGRYVYFKPQEHASKINRTFLTLSLLVLGFNLFTKIDGYLPFLPEYRWLFALCILVLLIAPLSILVSRVVWKFDKHGHKRLRPWAYNYMPINSDYFKTTVSKREREERGRGMTMTQIWEDEAVKSTKKNLHSDALLNIIALVVFIMTGFKWAHESYAVYGWHSLAFFIVISLWISAVFLDRGVFSWIKFIEKKMKR